MNMAGAAIYLLPLFQPLCLIIRIRHFDTSDLADMLEDIICFATLLQQDGAGNDGGTADTHTTVNDDRGPFIQHRVQLADQFICPLF